MATDEKTPDVKLLLCVMATTYPTIKIIKVGPATVGSLWVKGVANQQTEFNLPYI